MYLIDSDGSAYRRRPPTQLVCAQPQTGVVLGTPLLVREDGTDRVVLVRTRDGHLRELKRFDARTTDH